MEFKGSIFRRMRHLQSPGFLEPEHPDINRVTSLMINRKRIFENEASCEIIDVLKLYLVKRGSCKNVTASKKQLPLKCRGSEKLAYSKSTCSTVLFVTN